MLFPCTWPNYIAVLAFYCARTFSKQTETPFLDPELFRAHWQFLRGQLRMVQLSEGPRLVIDDLARKRMVRVASFALRKLEPQGELLLAKPNVEQVAQPDFANYPGFSAAAVALFLCAQAFAELLNKCPQVFYNSGDEVTQEYIGNLQRDLRELLAFIDAMLDLWQRCATEPTMDVRSYERLFVQALARPVTAHYIAVQMQMTLTLDVACAEVLDQLTRLEDMPL